MSLTILWADGFDNYNNATDLGTLYAGTTAFNGFGAGRTDGKAIDLAFTKTGSLLYQNFGNQTDITAAFATYNPISSQNGNKIFAFSEAVSGATLCQVDYGTANFVYVTLSNGTVYTGSIPIIPLNNWTHIQFRLIVGAAGSFAMYLNGSGTPAYTVTGIDTRGNSGAVTYCNSFGFVANGNPYNYSQVNTIDDLLLCSGGLPGDCRLQTDFPIANETVAFTPLANTNWQEVSETAMDSDTSYNSTSTVGARDTFQFTPLALPTGSSILGVFLRCAAAKTDAGTRTYQTVLTGTGGTSLGTVASLSTSYQYQQDNYTSFLSGLGLLTEAGINGFYPGYQLVS
jgi:hypothetical protein